MIERIGMFKTHLTVLSLVILTLVFLPSNLRADSVLFDPIGGTFGTVVVQYDWLSEPFPVDSIGYEPYAKFVATDFTSINPQITQVILT